MADIHIERDHLLGLPKARQVALQWAEQVEKELELDCNYEQGDSQDLLSFSRSGVSGTLAVTEDRFEVDARLGLLLGLFKDRIEGEIIKNLDTLLAKEHNPAAPQAAPREKSV